jgi:hypothetical protein
VAEVAATNPLHVGAERKRRGYHGRRKGASSSSSSRRPRPRRSPDYLGGDYDVEASVGHIRDLPNPFREMPAEMKKGPFGKFAVDVDNGFEPYYVVDADKKKKVADLKRAAQGRRRALPRHR